MVDVIVKLLALESLDWQVDKAKALQPPNP